MNLKEGIQPGLSFEDEEGVPFNNEQLPQDSGTTLEQGKGEADDGEKDAVEVSPRGGEVFPLRKKPPRKKIRVEVIKEGGEGQTGMLEKGKEVRETPGPLSEKLAITNGAGEILGVSIPPGLDKPEETFKRRKVVVQPGKKTGIFSEN